jgi:hypothetical protein
MFKSIYIHLKILDMFKNVNKKKNHMCKKLKEKKKRG